MKKNDIINRFLLMDLGEKERREKLQEEREKKGTCEFCCSKKNVKWRHSATAYHWDKSRDLEDPNRKLFMCDECAKDYNAHWDDRWNDYYSMVYGYG